MPVPPRGASIPEIVRAHQAKARLRGEILHKVSTGELTFVDVLQLAHSGNKVANSITIRQIFVFSPHISKELAERVRRRFSEIYARPVPMQASVGWLLHQESGGARLVALCEAVRITTPRIALNSTERRVGVGAMTRVTPPWPRFPFGVVPTEQTWGLAERARPPEGVVK